MMERKCITELRMLNVKYLCVNNAVIHSAEGVNRLRKISRLKTGACGGLEQGKVSLR
jgi:hypothetical protein